MPQGIPLRYGSTVDPRNPTGDPLFDTSLNVGRNFLWSNTLQQQGPAPYAAPPVPYGMTPFDVTYMHRYGSEAMEYHRQNYLATVNPVAPQLQRILSQNKHTKAFGDAMAKNAGTPAGIYLTQTAMANPLIQEVMGGDLLGGSQAFMNNAVNFHRMPGAFASPGDMAVHHGMALNRANTMAQAVTQRIYGQDAAGNRGLVPNQKFLRNFRTEEVFGLMNQMAETGALTTMTAPSISEVMEREGLEGKEGAIKAQGLIDESMTDRVGETVKAFSHARNVFGNRSMQELHQMANKMLGTESTKMDPKRLTRFFDQVAAMAAQTGMHVETLVKGHQMITESIIQFQGLETEIDAAGNRVSVGGQAEAMGMANMETVAGMVALQRRSGGDVSQGAMQNMIQRSAALTARRESSSMGSATRLMVTAARAGKISSGAYQRYTDAVRKDPMRAKQIYMEVFGGITDDPMKLLTDQSAMQEFSRSLTSNMEQGDIQEIANEIQDLNITADVNELGMRRDTQMWRQTNRAINRVSEVTGVKSDKLMSEAEKKEAARQEMVDMVESKNLTPEIEAALKNNINYLSSQEGVSLAQMTSSMKAMAATGDMGISAEEFGRVSARGVTRERRARMLDRVVASDGKVRGGGVAQLIKSLESQAGGGIIDKSTLTEARTMMRKGDAEGARRVLDEAAKGLGDTQAVIYKTTADAADTRASERVEALQATMGIGGEAQTYIQAVNKGEIEGLKLSDDLRGKIAGDVKTFTDPAASREAKMSALDSLTKELMESKELSQEKKNKFMSGLQGTGMLLDPTWTRDMGGTTAMDHIMREGATRVDTNALAKTTAETAAGMAEELGLSKEEVAGLQKSATGFGSRADKDRREARKNLQGLLSGMDDKQRAALQKKLGEKGEEYMGAVDMFRVDPGEFSKAMGETAEEAASKRTPAQAAMAVIGGAGNARDIADLFQLDVADVTAAVSDLQEKRFAEGGGMGGAVKIDTSGQPIPVVIVGEGVKGSTHGGRAGRRGGGSVVDVKSSVTEPLSVHDSAKDINKKTEGINQESASRKPVDGGGGSAGDKEVAITTRQALPVMIMNPQSLPTESMGVVSG